MWEESVGTQAGVHLIEGVRLIRGAATGFTVFANPSARVAVNHALRDAQNVCALTRVGTIKRQQSSQNETTEYLRRDWALVG